VQRNLGKVGTDTVQDVLLLLATNALLSANYLKASATLGVPPSPVIQMLMSAQRGGGNHVSMTGNERSNFALG